MPSHSLKPFLHGLPWPSLNHELHVRTYMGLACEHCKEQGQNKGKAFPHNPIPLIALNGSKGWLFCAAMMHCLDAVELERVDLMNDEKPESHLGSTWHRETSPSFLSWKSISKNPELVLHVPP